MKKMEYYFDYTPEAYNYIMSSKILRNRDKEILKDLINGVKTKEIAELEKMKSQIPQAITPTNLTQNFQLAPTNKEVIRYATSIDEVQKDIVIGDTPYFSRDLSVVWIKNVKGEIRSFELNEIIAKDNKDLMIENLQLQIKELRKEIKNANTNIEYVDDTDEDEKSTNVSNVRKSTTKQK